MIPSNSLRGLDTFGRCTAIFFYMRVWSSEKTSRKHAYIILTPLKLHFYKSKTWVFRGINYFSYFAKKKKNIDCGYSLEPPRRGGSNEYPQSMFCAEI